MAAQPTYTSNIISPEEAVAKLLQGQPVALPTETVYGLAAPIQNEKAIEYIFQIKNRPFFDPLIVHITNTSQLNNVLADNLPELAKTLAEKFWPGPLTMVLPKNKKLSPLITSGLESVAVRMPRHELTLKILEQTGPLAAPSANRFGKTSPTSVAHVYSELPNTPIVDGGSCDVGVESTVIGFTNKNTEIIIYRKGAITKEMLSPFAQVHEEESPVSPGNLKHHYMPDKAFVVLKHKSHLSPEDYEHLARLNSGQWPHLRWLNLSDNAALAAREFYAELRRQAESAGSGIIGWNMSRLPDNDLWAAIKDRASKAASLIL